MSTRRSLRRLTLALALALPLAACGSSDPSGPSTIPPLVAVEATTFNPTLGVNLATSTKLPSGVYVRDLTVGTGATVAARQLLSMRYTGWFADGTQFDGNATSGNPFQFNLGLGQVIAGWDQGIAGMRVGGKRQLVIPSELAYGPFGSGRIPPNAVLVFNVEVVAAQ